MRKTLLLLAILGLLALATGCASETSKSPTPAMNTSSGPQMGRDVDGAAPAAAPTMGGASNSAAPTQSPKTPGIKPPS